MEATAEYNTDSKTTTYTELDSYITNTFCMPKIFRDSEKPDPMTESMEALKKMFDEERDEMLKAYRIWDGNKTEKNANEFLEEIADVKNIVNFMAGQVAGYKKMLRA